jgi:predicted metal-dependent phosphoesterase TrpH
MIDLHSHTTESDGTLSPIELLQLAHATGLEALAITDHDTFSGYDQARRAMTANKTSSLELICGIEVSTRYQGRSVHLLGYFLQGAATEEFSRWILGLQAGRHSRNQKLVEKLQAMGFDITMEEVMLRGRSLPGRPHFAAILVEKKYAPSIQRAFDDYLDESGACYVPRDEPSLEEAVERITAAGGLPSLPHPGRISRDPLVIEKSVREMSGMGLRAIEVYHSDHSPADVSLYASLADRFSLAVTGGSDFHGGTKPDISLGIGRHGNLCIGYSVLKDLRSVVADRQPGTMEQDTR